LLKVERTLNSRVQQNLDNCIGESGKKHLMDAERTVMVSAISERSLAEVMMRERSVKIENEPSGWS
jgi:hypothetical protein